MNRKLIMDYPVYHLVLKTRALLEEEQQKRQASERAYEQQIHILAEQIRCAAIRERTSKGEILVGNHYYDQENPVWLQKALSQNSNQDDYHQNFARFPKCQNPMRSKINRDKHYDEIIQAQKRVNDAYANAIAPQFGGSTSNHSSIQTKSASTRVHVGGRKINIRR